MEILISAVAGDLISRFISSLAQNFSNHTCEEEDRTRLNRILLRMHSVVEEAEGRHITNRGMLLQLKGLIEGFYLGYYMLDKVKFQPPEEESIKDEDERVCNFFSHIFFFKEDDLKMGEHSVNSKASAGKYLFVIEFIWDVDEAAWAKFQLYLQNMAGTGIKVLVIGRTESIAKFGTTQPIRVKRLSEEEYWYYFKALAFGNVILGADIPVEDKFDVLVWRSRIPPYCDYIVSYKKQKALCMVGRRNHLALRKYKKKS
ncbi:hypothetical protein E2562_016604 [Oryza meyeriana var. granulata]|uniref:Rx N-terminal domain-containing protein n=1 Tax=Oryza meyeriana var. granulata TaxID=110450 RepID=A0A6G1C773_9ORYZ|nr:hypothetical protein E2562_016604 [Oryza meyeriana var. granulata]